MLDSALTSIYANSQSLASQVTSGEFLVCCLASIALGIVCALVYMFRHDHTKNFVVTLALLPLIVQMVITLVNGNLGVGIAVMGVFNLVRFRSIPGSAKDIGSVFLAMAIGLATGMGFIILAIVFTAIVAIVNVIYVMTPFGKPHEPDKMLRITIPKLMNVQTTNMGSLFQLEYMLRLKEQGLEKALIDELRCLNGNLKISLGYAPKTQEVL